MIIISLFAWIFSCVGQKSYPEVKNATYKPYQINGERGYIIEFELSNDNVKPAAVVINRIKKTISPADKNGLKYRINVIAETRKILNYKVKGSEKENGIYFSSENEKSFKPVEFELR
ncbi:hypothetical protein [Kaistella treverensis]|uniref:hypothetical protein n=1 Tax=Kaistella treverensis TaxID=631455 RepID=UPI001160BC8C|nr:hypothetical protein [Kaistella treverensis]